MLLLIVVGAGLAVTQTDWGEERIADLATGALRDELGLDAAFGDVEVRVHYLPPGITVEATDIDLDHPEHGDFVDADRLFIRPSLWAFLQGEVDLEDVTLERPRLQLLVRDGQLLNGPTLPAPAGGGTELPFERIRIRDARLELDALPHVEGELDHLDVEVTGEGAVLGLDLRADTGSVHHAGGDDALERLSFVGTVDLDDASAHVERAALRTTHMRVLVTGADVPFDPTRGWRGHVFARVDLQQMARLPIALPVALEGVVEAEADLEGTDGIPTGAGRVRLLDVRIDDRYGLGEEVHLELESDGERLAIQEGSFAQLIDDGGRVGLVGAIGLDLDAGFPLELDADIDGFRFAELMEQLSVTPDAIVTWPMEGTGRLEGTLVPFAIEGPLRMRARNFMVTSGPHHARPRERIIGVRSGRIVGRWRYDEEAASFTDITLETAGSRVKVPMVWIGYDNTIRVEGHAEVLDVADVSPLTTFELAGVGSADVLVEGTFDEPIVSGRVKLRDFRFDGFRAGDVEGDWRLLDDYMGVFFPSLRGEKNSSRYRVDDLTIDFADSRMEVTGRAHTSRLTLQDLYHVFLLDQDERYTPVQAVTRGSTSIRYTYGWPHDGPNGTLELDIGLDLEQASIDDLGFERGRFEGHFLWRSILDGLDGGELTIRQLDLHKGEGTLSIGGSIRPPGGPRGSGMAWQPYAGPAQMRLTVAADEIALQSLEDLREGVPQLTGLLSVLGEVRGTPSVPHMHLDVAFTSLRWEQAYLGDARAYVRLTDQQDPWVRRAERWEADGIPQSEPCAHSRFGLAHGRWPADPPLRTVDGPAPRLDRPMAFLVCGEGLGGQVKVDLALGWTRSYPARGIVDLVGLQLDPLLRASFPDRDLGGEVQGRVAFTGGALLDGGTLDGWVQLDRLRLASREQLGTERVALREDGPIEIDLVDGGFRVRRARLRAPGSRLSVRGTGDARGELALRVDGDLDLAVLRALSRTVDESAGRLALRINVNGRVEDPTVFGEARLEGGLVALHDFPAAIEDLEGRVEFSERRVLLDGVHARVAGGRLDVDGSATMREGALQGYGIALELDDAQLRPEDGVEVGLGGRARLEW
ncbi:MAG TPA: hypothetical protein RMH26_08290, partial [Polyangiaceae bacterium LLY-WYZ-15_(1-7)]|nr:hypothetical protein [Polyangiaceae bacterium LLY-WYZ-15_(1-7)]